MKKSLFLVFLILLVDQVVKISVKLTMSLGDEIPVFGHWFIIHFTENNGMAFGMEFAGEYGKLILTLFRVVAIGLISWYLWDLHKQKVHKGLTISIALILAGAMGNLLDSLFYGILFNDSYFQVATLFPAEGGYSQFLYGRVVDMFYCPIISGHYPAWFPMVGSQEFIFFRPVFNIADSSITIGVIILIFGQKKFFPKKIEEEVPVTNQ